MSRADFVHAVENKGIRNGTKFEVLKDSQSLGFIAVVDTSIMYLDIPTVPADLLTNDVYTFIEVKEEE